MARKACLHLEPYEREYLNVYKILPHNHYKKLIDEGYSSAQANEIITDLTDNVLSMMALKRKQAVENEYLELMKQNPFANA